MRLAQVSSEGQPGNVAARMGKAGDEPRAHGFYCHNHDDGEGRGRLLGGGNRRVSNGYDDIDPERSQFGGEAGEPLGFPVGRSGFDHDVPALDIAEIAQPLTERLTHGGIGGLGSRQVALSERSFPLTAPRRRAARRGDYLGGVLGRCVAPSRILLQLLQCRLEQCPDLRVARLTRARHRAEQPVFWRPRSGLPHPSQSARADSTGTWGRGTGGDSWARGSAPEGGACQLGGASRVIAPARRSSKSRCTLFRSASGGGVMAASSWPSGSVSAAVARRPRRGPVGSAAAARAGRSAGQESSRRAAGLRSLPHREPRRSPRSGAAAHGHNGGHNGVGCD
jgi:hypothetical protein